MLLRGLRIKIALVGAVLLLVSMLLTDFVLIRALQRHLVAREVGRFDKLLGAVQTAINSNPDTSGHPLSDMLRQLQTLVMAAEVRCAVMLHPNRTLQTAIGADCPIATGLSAQARISLKTGKRHISYHGQTWNVFWKQPLYVLVAAPLGSPAGNRMGASLAAVIDLRSAYQLLRRSQRLFTVYLLINLVVLTCLLMAYISRTVFRPLNRLAQHAETYQHNFAGREALFFTAEAADSEFRQVSFALNRMLNRIGDDQRKLRSAYNELTETHLELQRMQAEIVQTEKLATAGRLSAGIAHEIGNPIGIVTGYLDLLQQTDTTAAERRDYLQRAGSEIDRIDTIIRQLLDLSRPTKTASQPVEVHQLLRDLQKMAQVQPALAHLKIDLAADASRDIVIADQGQVRQVFLNLMLNAADATALGSSPRLRIGTVLLALERARKPNSRPWLEIKFSDNGPGIAASDLSNIFDPFFTTKDPGQGTGLGLSVCYMLIKNMGGTITAKNGQAKGAIVTIQLPLSE